MEMAITPPSDIVNDVARAADPARFQKAAAKLAEGARPIDGSDFDDAMQMAGAAPLVSGGFDVYSARNTIKNSAEASQTDRSQQSLKEFEAYVLQTFIESMLPKESENTYGKGNAGSIWRSMMAEQIAGEVAKAGGVGIADYLLPNKKAEKSDRAEDRALTPAGRAV